MILVLAAVLAVLIGMVVGMRQGLDGAQVLMVMLLAGVAEYLAVSIWQRRPGRRRRRSKAWR